MITDKLKKMIETTMNYDGDLTEVEKQISDRFSMALETTVLFPTPDGPERTISFPQLFILNILRHCYYAH